MAKTLAELENQEIKWVKSGFWHEVYQLRSDSGDVLGTMRRTSAWKSRYEVDAVGNRWQFERKGFWRQRIEIVALGSGDQPAVYHYRRPSGVLTYPDGRTFIWRKAKGWFNNDWLWTDEGGEPIIGFQQGGGFRVNASISMNPELGTQKAPSLLVFLGWYLLTMQRQDAAAAASVGIAAS